MPALGPPPLIDEQIVALLDGGISVLVSSAGDSLVPEVAYGYGCKASPDRRRLRVALDPHAARALLAAIAASGRVAVVVSRPSTMRALQFKGDDAVVAPLSPAERDAAARAIAGLHADLSSVGYPVPYLDALLSSDPRQMVCVDFQPTAVFEQTPGPQAGRVIAGDAP